MGRPRSAHGIFIALLGLGFLILIHEAGHFFASLAVGLRPRRFYVGFPPAIVKHKRNNIEYGLGAIPLGGFVSIPGMHRPIPHDAERRMSRAVSEAPALAGPFDRIRRGLGADDPHEALAPRRRVRAGAPQPESVPGRARLCRKGDHRAPRRARPGCLLEGGNVEAAGGDLRRPGGEHRPRDRPHDDPLHDDRRQGDVRDLGQSRKALRRRRSGSSPGTASW